jgi:DNA-binding NarL/FixJ family response regulator
MEAVPTHKIRALIVDDHEIVIEGMARVLALDGRVDVAWRAGSLAEAEAMADVVHPDVVLVDLRLPDARGYTAVSVVRGLYPDAKVVAITGYGKAAAAEAKRQGADAFLTKELASDVIAQTICGLFPSQQAQGSDYSTTLSSRELEIARLAAAGLTNPEIAKGLSISTNTVKTHLASVMRKLEIRNRVGLTLHFRKEEPQ